MCINCIHWLVCYFLNLSGSRSCKANCNLTLIILWIHIWHPEARLLVISHLIISWMWFRLLTFFHSVLPAPTVESVKFNLLMHVPEMSVLLNSSSSQAASSSFTRASSCSMRQPSASGSSPWTSWSSTAPSPTSSAPSPARPWWQACSGVTTTAQVLSWAPGPGARL